MRLGFNETVDGLTRIYEDGYGTIVVLSGDADSLDPGITADVLLRTLERAGIPRDAIFAALDQL